MKQQSAGKHVATTLSWFRANAFFLFPVNAACLTEKQQIPILLSLAWQDRGIEPTIYHTRGKHAYHYTTDAEKIYFVKNLSK